MKAFDGKTGELRVIAIPRRLVRRGPNTIAEPSKPPQDDGSAVLRLQAVYLEIVRACQTGELETATRPREGGEMSKLPAHVWNTDRWSSRFNTCEIDIQRPFEHPFTKDEGAWIFVISASLDKLLVSRPHHRIVQEDLPHLSPYLRTMIAVARRVEISPDNQVKKESLITEIHGAWKESTVLTNHLAQVMATLLREPGSQLGRRRPPAGGKKG
jgi:hypothetical protein